MPETYHDEDPWAVAYFAAVADGLSAEEAVKRADRIARERKQEEEACTPSK